MAINAIFRLGWDGALLSGNYDEIMEFEVPSIDHLPNVNDDVQFGSKSSYQVLRRRVIYTDTGEIKVIIRADRPSDIFARRRARNLSARSTREEVE